MSVTTTPQRPLAARGRAALKPAVLPLLAAFALLVLGWPGVEVVPGPGVDPSWRAGLHMAARDGLNFGTDVVYTYGPLGFLKVPEMWTTWTGWLALAYTVLLRLAFLFVAWRMTRPWLGAPLAFVVLALVATQPIDPALPLGFAAALWLATAEEDLRRDRIAVAVAVLAGIEALAKLNTGAAVLVLVVAGVLLGPARGRARTLALTLGSAAVAGLAGWLVTGNALTALPPFALNTWQIISGFSESMQLSGSEWQYDAAFTLCLVTALALWRVTHRLDLRRRAAAFVLLGGLAFVLFKQGFVRHSDAHVGVIYSTLLAVLVLLPWHREDRFQGLTALALAMVCLMVLGPVRGKDLIDPVGRVGRAFEDLALLVSPGERAERRDAGLAAIREQLPLGDDVLTALEGRTVHIAPQEASVAAAYGLRWDPLPVFQDYQAYTAGLDDVNTDRLLGDDAPERVLLQAVQPIDGRVAVWDPPAQQRALVCRYRPLVDDGAWSVLARAENRCGAERRLESVPGRWGEPAPVPAPSRPDRMVFVRIRGVQVQGAERVRSFLFRARVRTATMEGVDRPVRLVPGTAEDGLLVHVPESMELPGAFGPVEPSSISVQREGEPLDGPLLMDFYEVPVRP